MTKQEQNERLTFEVSRFDYEMIKEGLQMLARERQIKAGINYRKGQDRHYYECPVKSNKVRQVESLMSYLKKQVGDNEK